MQEAKERFDFQITWKPFFLRPQMPPEGIPKPDFKKDAVPSGRLVDEGKKVGLDFTFKCDRYPNTSFGHALMDYALEVGGNEKQDQVSELIFKAYFTDGIYPDAKALEKIGKEAGLKNSDVKKAVTDEARLEKVREEARNATRNGVSGVPCFYMNGVKTFSGAQDESAFLKMFDIVAEKHPL